MALGLKLLLGYRRDQGLVWKISGLIVFFQKREENKCRIWRELLIFCSDLFLNQNVYSLKDILDKRRF